MLIYDEPTSLAPSLMVQISTLPDLREAKFQCDRAGNGEKCAQLQGASLPRAHLEGAALGITDLQGASLDGAQLQGALLNDAFLEGAFLQRAQLERAALNEVFVWRTMPPTKDYLRGTLIEMPRPEPKYFGLDCPWERESCDWTDASYVALKAHIDTAPSGSNRDNALKSIEPLGQTPYEEDTASAMAWRDLAAESQRSAPTYPGELAKLLIRIGCGAGEAPYVIGGLIRQFDDRFRYNPAEKAEVAGAFLDEAHCPGARSVRKEQSNAEKKERPAISVAEPRHRTPTTIAGKANLPPLSSIGRRGPAPKGLRRASRAFGQRFEFGPADRRVADPRAEPAIGAGEHVFAAHEVGVADQALGHQIGMLDKIGQWPTTPGTRVAPSGNFTSSKTPHSCS